MTYMEFHKEFKRFQKNNPSWRTGQTLFNVLDLYRRDLSDKIRGTTLDPFYKDTRALACRQWIERNW